MPNIVTVLKCEGCIIVPWQPCGQQCVRFRENILETKFEWRNAQNNTPFKLKCCYYSAVFFSHTIPFFSSKFLDVQPYLVFFFVFCPLFFFSIPPTSSSTAHISFNSPPPPLLPFLHRRLFSSPFELLMWSTNHPHHRLCHIFLVPSQLLYLSSFSISLSQFSCFISFRQDFGSSSYLFILLPFPYASFLLFNFTLFISYFLYLYAMFDYKTYAWRYTCQQNRLHGFHWKRN